MRVRHYPDNYFFHLLLQLFPDRREHYPSWAPEHVVSYKYFFGTAYVYEATDA